MVNCPELLPAMKAVWNFVRDRTTQLTVPLLKAAAIQRPEKSIQVMMLTHRKEKTKENIIGYLQ
jgi:hypothetical protein